MQEPLLNARSKKEVLKRKRRRAWRLRPIGKTFLRQLHSGIQALAMSTCVARAADPGSPLRSGPG
jgi:hypothetical protein